MLYKTKRCKRIQNKKLFSPYFHLWHLKFVILKTLQHSMDKWHPTPVLLPGKSHGRRSRIRLHFHFHFSLSCIGEGNGNLLQCSCLENPRDAGAWWAAVYGVVQSRTRLKWLSSSSSALYTFRLMIWLYFMIFFSLHRPQATYSFLPCTMLWGSCFWRNKRIRKTIKMDKKK